MISVARWPECNIIDPLLNPLFIGLQFTYFPVLLTEWFFSFIKHAHAAHKPMRSPYVKYWKLLECLSKIQNLDQIIQPDCHQSFESVECIA